MNKIEYDDNYRYRKNPNFIENDKVFLYIKLRIGLFKHFYQRSDFKPNLLNNKVNVFEFEELVNDIEKSVDNFLIMTILLFLIYFSISVFILIIPTICLFIVLFSDENTNVNPIFILLIVSLIFGLCFLIILRFIYLKVLKKYEDIISTILIKNNKEKFLKKNLMWHLGKNCLYLKANLLDLRLSYDNENSYISPNEYIGLGFYGISEKTSTKK